MHKRQWLGLTVSLGLMVPVPGAGIQVDEWIAHFQIDKGDLLSTGRNPYFILEPGYYLVLKGGNARLTITVLSETRTVDGLETRVVEERETRGGQLIEVSRNYFALHEATDDVYSFGEDVDMYRGGWVINHGGAWLSGTDGARFGLMMPGEVAVDAKYYQEIAPEVGMDRAKIVGTSETVSAPAGCSRTISRWRRPLRWSRSSRSSSITPPASAWCRMDR